MTSAMRITWNRFTLSRRRVLWISGILVCCTTLIWLALSFWMTYSLTRRSRPRRAEKIPTIAGHKVQDERVRTADGEEIGLWYISGRPEQATVVLLHANGGRREGCLPQAKLLLKAGYSVLLVTCRAHGDSTGDYNDFGWGARHDVIAAVHWLRQHRPETKVVLWGASLGSAAAIFAARDIQPAIDACILECPYQDLDTAVRNRLDNSLPPVFEQACYVGMRISALVYVPHYSQISPVKFISTIPEPAPILILAGEEDRHARPDESRALQAQVQSRCRLQFFAHAAHLGLFHQEPQEYERVVLEFLKAVD